MATAQMLDVGGGDFALLVTHPDLTGELLELPFAPCGDEPPPTLGACCSPGRCSQETSDDCAAMDGSWIGPDTDCTECPMGALTVNVSGPGSVSSDPAGISCPADCEETYLQGVEVTLTATADPGAQFQSWSGSCGGADPMVQIVVDGDEKCTATFRAIADIALDASDDPDPVIAGNPLTYTIAVVNNGPSDATGVTVTDTLPNGVSFDPPSSDPRCTGTTSVTCDVGALGNGLNTILTIAVIVDPATRGAITNRASVTSKLLDPSTFNNTANIQTTVLAEADLAVAASAFPEPASAGGRLTYEVVVTNAGPSSATGVSLRATLPAELTPLGDPTLPGEAACGVGSGTIGAGKSATAAFSVLVDPATPNGAVLTTTIEVSANETDPTPADNTDEVDSTVAAAAPQPAAATFTKVADTDTPIPGGAGNFTRLAGGDKPVISRGNVAFRGRGDNQDGIYSWINGVLDVVADTSTPIPGGKGTFGAPATGGFSGPTIDGEDIAFGGDDATIAQRGVYTHVGGVLDVVADKDTRPAGSATTFSTLGSPSLDGGNLSFWAFVPANPIFEGLYLGNPGGFHKIADQTTFIPGGGGRFSGFNPNTQHRRGNVAFFGRNSGFESGLYTYAGGALNVIADANTPIPGGGGFMNLAFNVMSYDGACITFVAHNDALAEPRIYLNDCVGLTVLADTTRPIPCGTGTFTAFTDLALEGGNVASLGFGEAQSGIYADIGGKLFHVIRVLDVLDGKKISGLRFGRESLSGNRLVFTAIFTDGSEGIYVADLSASGLCNPFDPDADRDRDLRDHAAFDQCFTGRDGAPYGPGCEVFDADGDGDIDGDDYGAFADGLGGPLPPPLDEACCLPNQGGCPMTDPDECEFLRNGTVMPGETCADDPCSAGQGACCSIEGCFVTEQVVCNKLEGTFFPGQNCKTAPCK